LLATVSARRIGRAQMLFNCSSYIFENYIAYLMAVGIVYLFEMIDIQHQQREGMIIAAAAPHLIFEDAIKSAASHQSGKIIIGGQLKEPGILHHDCCLPADCSQEIIIIFVKGCFRLLLSKRNYSYQPLHYYRHKQLCSESLNQFCLLAREPKTGKH